MGQTYYFATNAAEASMANQTTPWVQEWLNCVFANDPNGQEVCTHIAQANLPNDALTESVFSLWFLCGIWATILIGTSPALMAEWLQVWFPSGYDYLKKKGTETSMLVQKFRKKKRGGSSFSTETTITVGVASSVESGVTTIVPTPITPTS
ncbi:hypothetical protein HK102_003620 [Quaeritorhiza haematococci]|nr:hypothetical protein HK102_003620 [Quaeritorhiza haematococci]